MSIGRHANRLFPITQLVEHHVPIATVRCYEQCLASQGTQQNSWLKPLSAIVTSVLCSCMYQWCVHVCTSGVFMYVPMVCSWCVHVLTSVCVHDVVMHILVVLKYVLVVCSCMYQ